MAKMWRVVWTIEGLARRNRKGKFSKTFPNGGWIGFYTPFGAVAFCFNSENAKIHLTETGFTLMWGKHSQKASEDYYPHSSGSRFTIDHPMLFAQYEQVVS